MIPEPHRPPAPADYVAARIDNHMRHGRHARLWCGQPQPLTARLTFIAPIVALILLAIYAFAT